MSPRVNRMTFCSFLRTLYPEAKIYAVGDYENDIEMLKASDVSVCPANAMEYVKKSADMTLCDCNGGVIADLVEIIERSI